MYDIIFLKYTFKKGWLFMAKMTKTTLDLIHREYQVAAEKSNQMLEIVKNLYFSLSSHISSVPQEDLEAFSSFLDGLDTCLIERQLTFELTDFFTDVLSGLMYIVKWLNDTQNRCIDVNWYGRRKSLESELTKILDKSCNSSIQVFSIRDRFGLRGILLNENCQEEKIELIYAVYTAVIEILVKRNSSIRCHFIKWYRKNPKISKLAQAKLDILLEIPFKIPEEYLKDYIAHPKPNTYQTLQFTLEIAMYSEILPGAQIEVQLRDLEMHYNAEFGKASHTEYKDEIDKCIQETFVLEDFSNLHLSGFRDYKQQYEDRDGLHYPKHFSDRRSI